MHGIHNLTGNTILFGTKQAFSSEMATIVTEETATGQL
jgi:hypothetical protein